VDSERDKCADRVQTNRHADRLAHHDSPLSDGGRKTKSNKAEENGYYSDLAVCGDGCGDVRRSGTGGKRLDDDGGSLVEDLGEDKSLNAEWP